MREMFTGQRQWMLVVSIVGACFFALVGVGGGLLVLSSRYMPEPADPVPLPRGESVGLPIEGATTPRFAVWAPEPRVDDFGPRPDLGCTLRDAAGAPVGDEGSLAVVDADSSPERAKVADAYRYRLVSGRMEAPGSIRCDGPDVPQTLWLAEEGTDPRRALRWGLVVVAAGVAGAAFFVGTYFLHRVILTPREPTSPYDW